MQSASSGGLPDPLEFIRDRIHNDASLEISSVYHLATLITSLCTAFVDQCTADLPDGSESFLQIFANAIGIEVYGLSLRPRKYPADRVMNLE